jgi:hypothetical protein
LVAHGLRAHDEFYDGATLNKNSTKRDGTRIDDRAAHRAHLPFSILLAHDVPRIRLESRRLPLLRLFVHLKTRRSISCAEVGLREALCESRPGDGSSYHHGQHKRSHRSARCHAFGRRFKPASIRRRTASLRVMAWLNAYSSTAAAIGGGRRAGTTIAAPSALGGLPIFFVGLRLDIPYTNSIDEPDLSYTISGPDGSSNFHPALTATRIPRRDTGSWLKTIVLRQSLAARLRRRLHPTQRKSSAASKGGAL